MTTEEFDRKLNEGTLKKWGENSRFTLLETNNKATSLEIVPETHSNIARFLNDANFGNTDRKEINKKNNVSVFRTSVKGKITAIMYANRIIKAGEELQWDYGPHY